MTSQELFQEALDLNQLSLPASLPVLKLEGEDYLDTTGVPSVRVCVLLDESADIEHISGRDVGDLKSAIRESLQRHGVTLFPYFRMAKPSELAQRDEED